MGKLTFDGNFCDIAMCQESPCPYNGTCSQRETWERLKAYEDTGLTPEQVEALSKELTDERYRHDRLQDWDRGMTIELEKYHELEREGRLLVLPSCKVGDTVYIDFYGSIRESTVKDIKMNMDGRLYISHGFCIDFVDDLGKRWFLTREDAEAHMKTQLPVELSEKTQLAKGDIECS